MGQKEASLQLETAMHLSTQMQQSMLHEQLAGMSAMAGILNGVTRSVTRILIEDLLASGGPVANILKMKIEEYGPEAIVLVENGLHRNIITGEGESLIQTATDAHREAILRTFTLQFRRHAEKEIQNAVARSHYSGEEIVVKEATQTILETAKELLRTSIPDPFVVMNEAIKARLQLIGPGLLEGVLKGKHPPTSAHPIVRHTLFTYEDKTPEREALVPVVTANIMPARSTDLADIEAIYESRRWTPHEALQYRLGNFDGLSQILKKRGVFLNSFDAYEKAVLTELMKNTEETEHLDPHTDAEERFELPTLISANIRHDLTQELMATALFSIPPLHPKKGTPYWDSIDETIEKWPKEKRSSLRKEFRKGTVGMLLLVAGKAKYAANLAIDLCIEKISRIRPDIQKIWSFFLQDLTGSVAFNFRNPEDLPVIAYSTDPLSNLASSGLLNGYDFATAGIYNAGKQNPDRTVFPLQVPEMNIDEHFVLDASWQLVIASMNKLLRRKGLKLQDALRLAKMKLEILAQISKEYARHDTRVDKEIHYSSRS